MLTTPVRAPRLLMFGALMAGVSVACSDGPTAPVDVALSVAVTGEGPDITQLSLSIDGQDPLPILIDDTLTMLMSPGSHTFHLALTPHNCPISDRPDPYEVTIQRSPTPFPVTFTLTCI